MSRNVLVSLNGCAVQVIKAYPQGKMSTHIHGLEVGDSLDIKGPMSKLPYTPNMKEKIGMVSLPCSLKAHSPYAADRIGMVNFWLSSWDLVWSAAMARASPGHQAGMPPVARCRPLPAQPSAPRHAFKFEVMLNVQQYLSLR